MTIIDNLFFSFRIVIMNDTTVLTFQNMKFAEIKKNVKNKLIIYIGSELYKKINVIKLYELIRNEFDDVIRSKGNIKDFSIIIEPFASKKKTKIKKIRKGKITDEKYLDKE